MATKKIKKSGIDKISDWTWCRPAPVANNGTSCTCSSMDDRYIYYIVSFGAGLFCRYDIINNSWNQLASPIAAPTTLVDIEYSNAHGHYGMAISNGGGPNKIEIGGLDGNVLVGKKIRITSGTGAGQERTIVSISDPIIHDRGVVTTANNDRITDASTGSMLKQWQQNTWRNYQLRVLYGAGANNLVRRILYNDGTNLHFYDANWSVFDPWWGAAPFTTSSTAGGQTLYQIESRIATVDQNWDVQPDDSSNFVVLSGGIWCITSNASAPFYTLQYYDVAADVWYRKSATGGIFPSALGTDVAIEVVQDSDTPLLSGTATSAESFTLTDSSLNLTQGTYSNYEIRIISGTGLGQVRTITSNNSNTFILNRSWDIIPTSNSTYEIHGDVGKIYIIGNNRSTIAQYDVDYDIAYFGKRFDAGTAHRGVAIKNGYRPIAVAPFSPLTSVTTDTYVSAISSVPVNGGSGYLPGQILIFASFARARILSVNASGAVTQVRLENGGGPATIGQYSTAVNPAGGTGCILNVTEVSNYVVLSTSGFVPPLKFGDAVSIRGANESQFNINYTVLYTASLSSYILKPLSPVQAGSATFGTQSPTLLIDASQNWATNEHAGKLLVVAGIGPNATSTIRKITSNTSTALTTLTGLGHGNGTHSYAIISDKAFGTDESIGSAQGASTYSGRGRSGVATSGTTTSLTDSSKNWSGNYWSAPASGGTGRKVRIIKGTGAGNEMVITSNTTTTLNFAPQSFTPDSTSVYVILDCFGAVTTGGTTTLTDNTQNWGTNIWGGKRVLITSGTGAGSESVINTNTATTLTLATSITTDTTSTYAILAPNNKGAGINMFDILNSSNVSLSNKYIYMFRGNSTNEITRYNITTEEIDNIMYFPFTEVLGTGSMYAYDGEDLIYFTRDGTGRIMAYNIVTNEVSNISTVPYGMGAASIGNRMDIQRLDNGDKWLFIMRHSGQEMWRLKLN